MSKKDEQLIKKGDDVEEEDRYVVHVHTVSVCYLLVCMHASIGVSLSVKLLICHRNYNPDMLTTCLCEHYF